MINALTQSPLISKKDFEWKDLLEKNELLVRDIIDIDSTYEDFENDNSSDSGLKKHLNRKIRMIKLKKKKMTKEKGEEKTEEFTEQDEFNVSLAAMEEEIKPKVIFDTKSFKNYSKLKKYQIEKLDCILNAKELSVSKNKNLKKIQSILVEDFKNLQLSPSCC